MMSLLTKVPILLAAAKPQALVGLAVLPWVKRVAASPCRIAKAHPDVSWAAFAERDV